MRADRRGVCGRYRGTSRRSSRSLEQRIRKVVRRSNAEGESSEDVESSERDDHDDLGRRRYRERSMVRGA